jgi:Raf kinase inhibitor-like YbhB/YbcL family protein
MKIFSTAFEDNQEIPTRYTCEGSDISLPLSWKDVPNNAQSLALIVEDPDAPDPKAPKILWIHWVLYNLDPKSIGLVEDTKDFPMGTLFGTTSWNNHKYGGPCPPIGRHRYFHKLYALDIKLPDLNYPTAQLLRDIMKGHVIADAVLMGTYQKKNT